MKNKQKGVCGMKRILFAVLLLFILLICFGLPLFALAEVSDVINTDMSGYLTPEEFGTFAGQVTFLVMVVQFIKLPIDRKIIKIKTEYLVYIVAVFTQVLAQATFHGFESFTWAYVPKCISYSFLLAVTGKEVYIKAIGNVEARKAELKHRGNDAPAEIMKPPMEHLKRKEQVTPQNGNS
jgi:hypothetical protein